MSPHCLVSMASCKMSPLKLREENTEKNTVRESKHLLEYQKREGRRQFMRRWGGAEERWRANTSHLKDSVSSQLTRPVSHCLLKVQIQGIRCPLLVFLSITLMYTYAHKDIHIHNLKTTKSLNRKTSIKIFPNLIKDKDPWVTLYWDPTCVSRDTWRPGADPWSKEVHVN